ncbi:MAG TPA: hypothetical protein DD638_12510 [Pasteurellaceae bacterium]|nr:hypothetical protein [Pasteurellaceae bacterium]
MEPQQIEQILKQALNLNEVYAQGENAHFSVTVVSDEIAAMTKVKQHQTVYAPLAAYFTTGEIHALTIRTFSVDKWKRERILNVIN